jgi:hypothetical protein
MIKDNEFELADIGIEIDFEKDPIYTKCNQCGMIEIIHTGGCSKCKVIYVTLLRKKKGKTK